MTKEGTNDLRLSGKLDLGVMIPIGLVRVTAGFLEDDGVFPAARTMTPTVVFLVNGDSLLLYLVMRRLRATGRKACGG